MIIKRKIILFTSLVASAALIATTISCTKTNEVLDVNAELGTSWWVSKTNENEVENYQKLFNETAKKLYEENPDKYKGAKLPNLKITDNDNNEAKLTSLKTSKIAFTILNVQHAVTEINNKDIVSGLQTLTTAFKEDNQLLSYKSNADAPKYLQNTAPKWVNEYLLKKPFQTWGADEKWNGTRWDFLYDTSTTVPFYRGMIMYVGNDATRAEIKKAWDDKDWEKFYKFGIVHGRNTSQGKYIIINKLFKDHFPSLSNVSDPIASIPSQYKERKDGNQIGVLTGKRIFIDDMYSFAWQNNKDQNVKANIFNPPEGEKIQILSLTNPLFYDIMMFNKSVIDDATRQLVEDTFIELSKSGNDSYGVNSGYNSYRKINDFNKEVEQPYKDALGL